MARCPHCRRHFRVMEDEEGMHNCPHCGYGPDEDRDRHDFVPDPEDELYCKLCGASETDHTG